MEEENSKERLIEELNKRDGVRDKKKFLQEIIMKDESVEKKED